jgi:hypothetical protein
MRKVEPVHLIHKEQAEDDNSGGLGTKSCS